MKTVDDIIRALEEIEEEGLPPIEFARKSAELFNTWAEENPVEMEILLQERMDWCAAYYKRVNNRMKGVNFNEIWPDKGTTQDDDPHGWDGLKEEELP